MNREKLEEEDVDRRSIILVKNEEKWPELDVRNIKRLVLEAESAGKET